MKKWFSKLGEKIEDFFIWLFYGDHKLFYGRVEIPLKGEKWDIHIADPDFFPSVPHLHAVRDRRIRIDVYTGEVYFKRVNTGKLSDKDFYALWHNEKFLEEVKKARIYYVQEHPNYKLPDLPFDYI